MRGGKNTDQGPQANYVCIFLGIKPEQTVISDESAGQVGSEFARERLDPRASTTGSLRKATCGCSPGKFTLSGGGLYIGRDSANRAVETCTMADKPIGWHAATLAAVTLVN